MKHSTSDATQMPAPSPPDDNCTSATSRYFDQLYLADSDPWQTHERWYERRKRAIVLAALSQPNYRCAFEPGCGAGELTVCLAERCGEVLACDYSKIAVSLLEEKYSDKKNIRFEHRALPAQWPPDSSGKFDLIVVSELAYYMDKENLCGFIAQCVASLAPGGEILASHWRRPFHDRRQNTEAIHERFGRQTQLCHRLRHTEADFLLDVWQKTSNSPERRSVP